MISREVVNDDHPCVDCPSKRDIIIGERRYKFDRVFKESCGQAEVYDECVKELILGCFEGYNAAMLAYGQTGSKKCLRQVGRPTRWAPTPPAPNAHRRE